MKIGSRGTLQKSVMIGVLGVVIVAIALVLSMFLGDAEAPPRPAPAPAPAPKTTAPAAKVAQLIAPTFDVVRINPGGNAVMAGRAQPGSRIEILDGQTVFGTVTTDANGEWVFVPEALLEPGERRLGLRMTADGQGPVLSDHVVILVVPERGADDNGALALKVRRDGTGPSEVLQKPGAEDVFGVDSVDYGDDKISISGHATPGLQVQLYVDNTFIGRTVTNRDGRWSITPESEIAPGTYTLRADMVDDKAQVLARRELPFQRAEAKDIQNLDPDSFIVVQPGNSLWRLAERTYGRGLRFHTIYQANQKLIRDPNLIYPGQVFRLPRQ